MLVPLPSSSPFFETKGLELEPQTNRSQSLHTPVSCCKPSRHFTLSCFKYAPLFAPITSQLACPRPTPPSPPPLASHERAFKRAGPRCECRSHHTFSFPIFGYKVSFTDTPIHAGYLNGFYEKIIKFFRSFFSAGLKDNTLLYKAVLTGILRVSRESLFSGVNHLDVFSVLSPRYSSYFGFTETEVTDLLIQAKMEDKLPQVKDWYNGYHIGEKTLYNPWSIINFIQKGGVFDLYWVNTSDNELIKTLLAGSSFSFKDAFEGLLLGNSFEKLIDENIVFSDLKRNNPTSIWSLFLMSGYLTVLKRHLTPQGSLCTLSIPNKEIRFLFQRIIEQWFSKDYGLDWYNEFLDHLLTGNIEKFSFELKQIMEHTVSVHDTSQSPEAFYHGLMIGLTASLHASPSYEIRSNRESGEGRYDYAIISREAQKLSILMEFKQVKEPEGKKFSDEQMTDLLKQTAETALDQISQKVYCAEIEQRGLTRVLKIGLAFSGKKFCLVHVLSGV